MTDYRSSVTETFSLLCSRHYSHIIQKILLFGFFFGGGVDKESECNACRGPTLWLEVEVTGYKTVRIIYTQSDENTLQRKCEKTSPEGEKDS